MQINSRVRISNLLEEESVDEWFDIVTTLSNGMKGTVEAESIEKGAWLVRFDDMPRYRFPMWETELEITDEEPVEKNYFLHITEEQGGFLFNLIDVNDKIDHKEQAKLLLKVLYMQMSNTTFGAFCDLIGADGQKLSTMCMELYDNFSQGE